MTKPWSARVAAFFLWALVALSASYWAMRHSGVHLAMAPAGVIAEGPGAPPAPAQVEHLRAVFGPAAAALPAASMAAAPAPDPLARMRLVGVVATRARAGVALIALDGQAARPYRVGSVLDGVWRLQQVDTRSATLVATQGGADPRILQLVPVGTSPAGAGSAGTARPAARSAPLPPATGRPTSPPAAGSMPSALPPAAASSS